MSLYVTEDFEAFCELIYAETGIVLNESKRCLLCARLAKRLRVLALNNYSEYYDHLMQGDPEGVELQEMINAITTNKTDFFRERYHFDFLTKRVFPEMLQRARHGGPRRVRIWCAASSLGHEPYSLAMTVREFSAFDASWDVRILATDIDTKVLRDAKAGVFNAADVAPAGDDLVRRYFDRGRGQFAGKVRAKATLRDVLTFRRLNLIAESWPLRTAFDVVFCRNVMIYFDAATQRHVIEHVTRHLVPNGYLMLGHSESIHWAPTPLKPLGQTVFQCSKPAARKTVASESR